MTRFTQRSTLGLVMLALVFLTACSTNPETGRKSLVLVPDSVMNNLGAQSYKEVISQEKISTNQNLVAIVERVANRITPLINESFDWEVKLVESDQANAFVLPGGKIVVYTGILPILETESGLAFVMGHEIGHAVARHGAERMTQSVGLQAVLTIADLSLDNSAQKGTIMGALGAGAQYGVLMPFSRAHESEADHMGILYMARAGYDPRVAPEVWRRMAKLGGEQPAEWMSTHPSHETRASDLDALMKKALDIYNTGPVRYGDGSSLK